MLKTLEDSRPYRIATFSIHKPGLHGAAALTIGGQFLILVGLLHVPFYFTGSSGWEGSVSWRKPILFGVSTGMTLWSLGWLVSRIKPGRMQELIAKMVAVALVLEVGLITLQQWRGVASHFNHHTRFDAMVDWTMLILISIAVVGIGYIGFRSFGAIRLTADYRLAFRLGMLFLIGSCVIGYIISFHGFSQIERGQPPGTIGARGVAKFPHGIAIHALQLLPALVWVCRKLGIPGPQRLGLIQGVGLATGGMLTFAVFQTVMGFARFEVVTLTAGLLLGLSLVFLVVPLAGIAKSAGSQ